MQISAVTHRYEIVNVLFSNIDRQFNSAWKISLPVRICLLEYLISLLQAIVDWLLFKLKFEKTLIPSLLSLLHHWQFDSDKRVLCLLRSIDLSNRFQVLWRKKIVWNYYQIISNSSLEASWHRRNEYRRTKGNIVNSSYEYERSLEQTILLIRHGDTFFQ